jgi:hypothetical protein
MTPEQAEQIIVAASPRAVDRINDFTREVFHTRGGRIGSGMGLLLEGLWGYFVNKELLTQGPPASSLQIAWITHHEYNDFACVLRHTAWDAATRAAELLRIEAKSMIASAEESKAHFDQLGSYFSPHDLLLVLMWDWEKLDAYSFCPVVLDQFIGKASEVAALRDALHLRRGGSFVDRMACPDGCDAKACRHHGEPLNASGRRERLTGPMSRKCYVPDSQRNLRSEFLTYIEGKERDFVGEIARRRG